MAQDNGRRKRRGIQFDSPDEREVFHAKESWIPLVFGGIPFVLLGIIAFVVAWRVFDKATIGLILLGIFVVIALVTRVPKIIENLDTDVIVTDKRIYARSGIIDIEDKVCDLATVSDTTVDPTVLGRIFDYADVRIQTYAGDQDFELGHIAHAYEMRKAINRGADANKANGAVPPHPTHGSRS